MRHQQPWLKLIPPAARLLPRLCTITVVSRGLLGESVSFVAKTPSPNLPLSVPAYLRIHATCCHVMHLLTCGSTLRTYSLHHLGVRTACSSLHSLLVAIQVMRESRSQFLYQFTPEEGISPAPPSPPPAPRILPAKSPRPRSAAGRQRNQIRSVPYQYGSRGQLSRHYWLQ